MGVGGFKKKNRGHRLSNFFETWNERGVGGGGVMGRRRAAGVSLALLDRMASPSCELFEKKKKKRTGTSEARAHVVSGFRSLPANWQRGGPGDRRGFPARRSCSQ